MKKFLLKITLFFFPFFVYFVLIPIMAVAIRSSRISLELPKDKTILFIGDSHIECGVNEKFIPGAFNWAKAGESFLNLFSRIRKLLNVNPQVHTVFISVTPRNLVGSADDRIYNGDAEIFIQRSIIFYEAEELLDSRKTIVNTLKDSETPKRALKAMRSKDLETIGEFGGFPDLGESSEKFWKEIEDGCKLGKERLSAGRSGKYGNELSLKYLRKIVELVRARGVRIIFLNPPLYHAEEFFDVSYFEGVLKENFSDVEFWDYGNFPMPENCFYNVNHLNGRGAEVFSKELARRIRKEGIASPSSI